MKKNKMMRSASGLVVMTMLTTCVIGGAFAKYVTTGTGTDTARVAKWGIVMDSTGSAMFSDEYQAGSNTTVKTSGAVGDSVVAPGTSGSAVYKVTGTPETAYTITFDGLAKNDVFLADGLTYAYEGENVSYSVPANADGEQVNGDYYPVNYSVKVTSLNNKAVFESVDGTGTALSNNTAKTFDTLEEAMAALNNTKVVYANGGMSADLSVTIGWAWQFDSKTTSSNYINVTSGHTSNNDYDTVLGDIAAKNVNLLVDGNYVTSATLSDSYDTTIDYDLVITATQVD